MRRLVISFVAMAACAGPLEAQTLREDFFHLFTFGDCGQPLCLDVNQAIHGNHYNPSITQGEHDILGFVNSAIGLSLTNIPFTSASSGVAFSFEGGVPVAHTISPGPIFAERASTLGRGRLLLGANLTGISFDNLRGVPLDNLTFNFTHQNVGGAAMGDPSFENDIIQVRTDLSLSLLVTSLSASYGVTDRVDVGVTVPLVHASLSGSSVATINQYEGAPSPHYFGTQANPTTSATSSTDGSATGIGDLGLRIKAGIPTSSDLGLALVADVRLPTGDEDNFLGSGATTVRVFGVASQSFGRFTPHANGGFLYTNGDSYNNRLLGTIGFDQLLSDAVTVAVDLVTSFETGESKLILPGPVTFTAPTPRQVELSAIPDEKDNFIDASVGLKLTLPRDVHVVTNLLVPMMEAGLRPNFTWTVGLERTF